MDLRNFTAIPDEEIYEKIHRRLVRRRIVRLGATIAAVGIVVAGVVIGITQTSREPNPVAQLTPTDAVQPTILPAVQPVAETETATGGTKQQPSPSVATQQPVEPRTEPHRDVTTLRLEDLPMPTAEQPVAVVPPAATPTVGTADIEAAIATLPVDAPTTEPAPTSTVESKASSPAEAYRNVVWAPNIIIPSADDDDNRYFRIASADPLNDFVVRIYNRRGQMVYTSHDRNFRWDGTSQGTQMPQGAYVWVVSYRDANNRTRQEKGTVTVVR